MNRVILITKFIFIGNLLGWEGGAMEKESKRNTWKLSSFGKKVKMKLIEREMTVSDLAKEIGTSRSFLSQMLYGDKKGYEYIQKLKEILDITDDYPE